MSSRPYKPVDIETVIMLKYNRERAKVKKVILNNYCLSDTTIAAMKADLAKELMCRK